MKTRWARNKKRNLLHLHVLGESKIERSNITFFWQMKVSRTDPNEYLVTKFVPYLYHDKDGERWVWISALLAGEKTDDFVGSKLEALKFIRQKRREIHENCSQ